MLSLGLADSSKAIALALLGLVWLLGVHGWRRLSCLQY